MAEDHQTQEQSIKDRKKQLFDAESPIEVVGPGKPFKEFLRDTPAAPLSGAMKAALWGAGLLIVLLLAAALMKTMGSSKKPSKTATYSQSIEHVT